MSTYFAKYRGKVTNNVDPLGTGRIQVSVPAVLGAGSLSWAVPCVPFAGPNVGFFMVPPLGANVWVEFEGGDPDYPIWSGCFWGQDPMPARPALEAMHVIKTNTATITINDLPGAGGVTIELSSGAKVSLTATSVEITNGQASIALTGPNVSINQGALEVT
jgi:uncharacterized protein involved in type VI secretion and phage assembly